MLKGIPSQKKSLLSEYEEKKIMKHVQEFEEKLRKFFTTQLITDEFKKEIELQNNSSSMYLSIIHTSVINFAIDTLYGTFAACTKGNMPLTDMEIKSKIKRSFRGFLENL